MESAETSPSASAPPVTPRVPQHSAVPIAVDGELIAGGVGWQRLIHLVRKNSSSLPRLGWIALTQGSGAAGARLRDLAPLEPECMPYRAFALEQLHARRDAGERLALAGGDDPELARRIAQHLGLFDAGVVETRSPSHARAPGRPFPWAPIFRALRIHQWAKNALLIAPLLLAHQADNHVKLANTLLAVGLFCLASSSIYILNDALDLHDDRLHPTKRRRPFAAGEIPVSWAPVIVVALLTLSLLPAAVLLPGKFILLLVGYVTLSGAYTLYFKRKLLVDVIVLAGLYTLRILAGGAAAEVEVSPWLMAFSIFLFLSLAFAKRYTELAGAIAGRQVVERQTAIRGRGYMPEDLDIIRTVGPCSGYLAALVFAQYIHSSELVANLYKRPLLLWLICPLLLYWITRIWFLARRGVMVQDPVLFAMTDRISWYAAGIAILLVYLASG